MNKVSRLFLDVQKVRTEACISCSRVRDANTFVSSSSDSGKDISSKDNASAAIVKKLEKKPQKSGAAKLITIKDFGGHTNVAGNEPVMFL